MKRDFRKPLIIMAPKSLLRHPAAVSRIDDFVSGSFQEIIDDPLVGSAPHGPPRLILCSGKVYYDLCEFRDQNAISTAAIVRIEQLYPLHTQRLAQLAKSCERSRLVWCQEESNNMGAWQWIAPQLEAIFGRKPAYAGRGASASPSVGLLALHKLELNALLHDAFSL
jgi:2-oxoglutarate dehydrogenase E1 component